MRLLLGLGVLLSPFYVWSSGGLQPGHMVLGLGFVVAFTRLFPNGATAMTLAIFAIYVVAREAVQVILDAEPDGLLPGAHIVFGYCTYVMVGKAIGAEDYPRKFARWLLAAALLALAGVLILGSGAIDASAGRAVGTFNNPNQLGYFGVLVASIGFLLWFSGNISYKLLFALMVPSIYLSIASLSKSAIVSALLTPLAFAAIVSHRRTRVFIVSCICIVVSSFVLAEAGLLPRMDLTDFAAYHRFAGAADESDSSLAVRGYTLLSEASWWQLMVGFSSEVVADLRDGYEVHSTYMAPLASYGIIGGGLFLAFLVMFNYRLFARFGALAWLGGVMPIMLYGIAHNGARTPLFWVYIGVALGLTARRAGTNPPAATSCTA